MSTCGVCGVKVNRDEPRKISCVNCNSVNHLKCLKLSDSDLSSASTPNPTWRCINCTSKDRRLSTSSSVSSVGGKRTIPKDTSLDAFRRVFEEKVTEMNKNNAETNRVLESAMLLLKELKEETREIRADNELLKEKTSQHESRWKEYDRVAELTAIEILDVPADIRGNVHRNASNMLTTALNIDVPEETIADCFIINMSNKGRKSRPNNQEKKRDNIWIVRFLTRRMRDRILDAVRQSGRDGRWNFNCKTTEDRDCNIRVRERISAYTRGLYAEARKAATELNWKFVWIKNGRVHVRVKEEGRVFLINSSDDLSQVDQQ